MDDDILNAANKKQEPEGLSLDPPKKKVTRINRKTVGIGASVLGGLLMIALIYGLESPNHAGKQVEEPPAQAVTALPSDRIGQLPSDYAGATAKPVQPELQAQPALMAGLQPAAGPEPSQQDMSSMRERERQDRDALTSDVFFVKPDIEQNITSLSVPKLPVEGDDFTGRADSSYGSQLPEYAQQNLQGQKLSFLNEFAVGGTYLERPYQAPISKYEVKAGTVIPGALVTVVDSDLPGDVIAQVTQNVYDTVTGRYLLIPQGAKLYGRYDSVVAYGQSRALVAWQRLIMPNGYSIQLDGMIATDRTGASGLSDEVDYHLSRLASGILMSTAISWAGNLADDEGDGDSFNDVGATVAQEASRVGQEITRRNLDVQPTIRVRAGYPVRVLVNQDMVLSPYQF